MKTILIIFCILFFQGVVCRSQDSVLVVINGRAYDATDWSKHLDDLMIINMRTSQGIFGKADGSFSMSILKSDTILVASSGYEYRYFSVSDSVQRESYYLPVSLTRLNVKLKEVTIFSPRDLESIYQDIKKLGYNKSDFEISEINALESPITFLYQEFSRFERLRRHNAERVNDDKRRNLLKDLLVNYVNADIINLESQEFDDFINFCNVPEDYMKRSTQYDFCIYIKRKYELYRMVHVNRKR